MAAISLTASTFTALGLTLPLLGMALAQFTDQDDNVLVKACTDGDAPAYRGLVNGIKDAFTMSSLGWFGTKKTLKTSHKMLL